MTKSIVNFTVPSSTEAVPSKFGTLKFPLLLFRIVTKLKFHNRTAVSEPVPFEFDTLDFEKSIVLSKERPPISRRSLISGNVKLAHFQKPYFLKFKKTKCRIRQVGGLKLLNYCEISQFSQYFTVCHNRNNKLKVLNSGSTESIKLGTVKFTIELERDGGNQATRRTHNPEIEGSNPSLAINFTSNYSCSKAVFRTHSSALVTPLPKRPHCLRGLK